MIRASWFDVISETYREMRHYAKTLNRFNVQHLEADVGFLSRKLYSYISGGIVVLLDERSVSVY